MRILGIDPGTAITGWGIIELKDRSTTKLVSCGCIKTKSDQSLDKRLVEIFDDLQKIISEYKPDVAAIEELFFAKNVKTAIAVGHGRGAAMLAVAKAKIHIYEYTPLQVKQAVVGYGRAEKAQVQEMLKLLLGTKDIPKQDDTSDALAVALTHAHTRRYFASA